MNPRRLTPSMSSLIAFEAAARHLSFTRAAAELSLTQSAVSRQVQALENLLDVQLFRRENRRIALTDAGKIYQRELSSILQRIRNASLQVITSRSGGGSLHLAALPTFAAKWLLPRLHDFYARHPGILIHIHSRIGQFDLDLAGIDAVIGVGDGIWPGMQAHHLMDETLIPVISPALLESHSLTTPADLTRYPLLHVAARPYVWQRWFKKYGLPPESMKPGPRFELTSHLIQAVSSGMGIGLLPDFLVDDELKNNRLQIAFELPLKSEAAYYLFIPADRQTLMPIEIFKNWLLQFSGESQ